VTLTFDPLTLNFYSISDINHVLKLCTQFERNGIIRGRVIDDSAHFRGLIHRVGHVLRSADGSQRFMDRTSL